MAMKKYIRILVIEGEADWVETTLRVSHIQPDKPFDLGMSKITEILREEVIIDE